MRTRRIRELPGRVEGLRKRFERWRKTRKPRTRIPDSLWAAAVEIAGTYGLAPTARAISLEYMRSDDWSNGPPRREDMNQAPSPLCGIASHAVRRV